MLFIEFSLAFNPIIHQQFIDKLDLLGFSTSLSNWIQSVQVPSKTSTTITLSTAQPTAVHATNPQLHCQIQFKHHKERRWNSSQAGAIITSSL